MRMKILSVDQSYTHCAFVISDETEVIDFGVFSTKAVDNIYDRALTIANNLSAIFSIHHPEIFKIEGLAFGMRGNATRDLAGLLFTIITVMKQKHGFHNFKIISPKTLKKVATGSGKATKKEMIAALPEAIRTKFSAENYKLTTGLADLADAYWLAKCE